jgi:amidase
VPSSFAIDFRLYWALLATWQVKTIRRAFGGTFDQSRLNSLTLGLDRYARRNRHHLPGAIMRLRAVRRHTARFFGPYDAMLTPDGGRRDADPRSSGPRRPLTAGHRPIEARRDDALGSFSAGVTGMPCSSG